jgi:hypothetical protein
MQQESMRDDEVSLASRSRIKKILDRKKILVLFQGSLGDATKNAIV